MTHVMQADVQTRELLTLIIAFSQPLLRRFPGQVVAFPDAVEVLHYASEKHAATLYDECRRVPTLFTDHRPPEELVVDTEYIDRG